MCVVAITDNKTFTKLESSGAQLPDLLSYPPLDRAVDLSTGIRGMWMPGFIQFVTGVYLFVGLIWFGSFQDGPPYMATLSFTAYGMHRWALGMQRSMDGDPGGVLVTFLEWNERTGKGS